jgi:cephalosporin hydroxylase
MNAAAVWSAIRNHVSPRKQRVLRSFRSAFDKAFLDSMQAGVLSYTYKGVLCRKCPLDMAIYTKLIWDLQPRTLIEIGTLKGGSALWLADVLTAAGIEANVVSIDFNCQSEVVDPRIEFLEGDVHDLGQVLTKTKLAALPRPLLVIEDSAHTYTSTLAALRFFDRVLRPGEVLVIEDGVLDELGLSEKYDGGPNRAIAEFWAGASDRFELMTEYCDTYGVNASYNPNAFLRRLA